MWLEQLSQYSDWATTFIIHVSTARRSKRFFLFSKTLTRFGGPLRFLVNGYQGHFL